MIFSNSRYCNSLVYSRRGESVVLGLRKRYEFNNSNCSFYTVIQGDTLDGIAFKLYGKASLWWAILDANKKYQSELDIQVGDTLRIPQYEEVVKYCG